MGSIKQFKTELEVEEGPSRTTIDQPRSGVNTVESVPRSGQLAYIAFRNTKASHLF